MSNEPKNELVVKYEIDGVEIKLTPTIVQQFIVGSDAQITLAEFKFFTELCRVRKLNPFLKEAYCIKYGNNPAQIVVGKDAIIKRAILNPNYDGSESGVILRNKETGEIIERQGTFYLKDKEELVGGWARVYRKNWNHPTYCSVSFDEVAQRKADGSLNQTWRGKGATMIEKVAKVRAMRETFVDDLGGMYEAEEMGVELPKEEVQTEEVVQQGEPYVMAVANAAKTISMDDI